jgi:hypothetical protein
MAILALQACLSTENMGFIGQHFVPQIRVVEHSYMWDVLA